MSEKPLMQQDEGPVEVLPGVRWYVGEAVAVCGACGNTRGGLDCDEAARAWGDGHQDICEPVDSGSARRGGPGGWGPEPFGGL